MDESKDSQYYVIEFIQKPYKDISKYVCIYTQWVVYKDYATQTAWVKYPAEHVLETSRLVQNKEIYLKSWATYEARVIHATDTFQEAHMYINKLIDSIIRQQNACSTSQGETSGKKQNPTVEKRNKILTNKRKFEEYIKIMNISNSQSGDVETKTPKKTKQNEIVTEIKTNNNSSIKRDMESNNNGNKSTTNYNQTHNVQPKRKNNNTNPTSDDRTNPYSNPTSDKSNPNASINTHSKEQESTTKVKTKTKNQLELSDINKLFKGIQDCFNENKKIMQSLNVTFSKNCSNIENLVQVMNEYTNLLKEKVYSNFEKDNRVEEEQRHIEGKEAIDQDIQELESESVNEYESLYEREKNEYQEGNHEDNNEIDEDDVRNEDESEQKTEGKCDNESSEDESLPNAQPNTSDQEDLSEDEQGSSHRQRPRGQPYDFTLPPEYDANDSGWTLKYRSPSYDLTELTRNSKIYVQYIKLKECTENSRNARCLIRNLLTEIFTESAMSTCSATGKQANPFKGSKLRPGLDQRAVSVLLNFVDKHAHFNEWDRPTPRQAMSVIRNKLQEMRAKYARRRTR